MLHDLEAASVASTAAATSNGQVSEGKRLEIEHAADAAAAGQGIGQFIGRYIPATGAIQPQPEVLRHLGFLLAGVQRALQQC